MEEYERSPTHVMRYHQHPDGLMAVKSLPAATPKPGSGKREQNKVANRSAILAAASKCFLKMGYDAVTIRDVVRDSGLAAGTFYNYFTDKDALFKGVLEARINEVNESMHAVRMKSTTIEDFLYGAFHALFSKIAADPSFFRLILRNETAVLSLFENTVIGIPMRTLKEDFSDAIARGVFPEIDIELLAAACYGMGFELGRVLAFTRKPDAAATAHFATTLMTNGISGFGIAKTASAAKRRQGEVPIRGSLP